MYQVTKGGALKKPRTEAATYYGVRWADSVVLPHHLPHFADWNYHPRSTQRCPSKLYGQAARKLLLLVNWKESEEPATDLCPLLIDQFKTRQAQPTTPTPPPPPRDAALSPLERQGVIDNPPFAWPAAWHADEVLSCITLSTDPVHPDRDIAPTGEYTLRVERRPSSAQERPLEGHAHVYDRTGRWLGKITLEQIIDLRARFQATHRRDPKLFTQLQCSCDWQGFTEELALLLQRWQATAKALSDTALQQQHGTVDPQIVQALQETMGIDTELFAGPLHLHRKTDYYYSTDPRDQLFGAQMDAFSHRWEGRCFAHPPHHQEELTLRWAVSSARATQRAVLTVMLLPGHHLSEAGSYACQPEVRILGRLSGFSPLLPADSTQSRERGFIVPGSLDASLTLAVVANTSGHSHYDAEQVCAKLTEVCKAPSLKFDLHESMAWPFKSEWAERKRHHKQRNQGDNRNETTELQAPRRFKASGRRFYPADPKMRLLPDSRLRRAADICVEHFNDDLPPAYDASLAAYTDGSLQEQKEGPSLLGAGIYKPEQATRDPLYFLINPNGRGPTKTINRAELVAIYHALHDPRCCSPEEPLDIFTDSQVAIQLISKAIYRPHALTGADICLHLPLLLSIARMMLERAARGVPTRILKVKSHCGIYGNEEADALAKEAARASPEDLDATTPYENPFDGKWWPASAVTPAAPTHSTDLRTVSNLRKGLKEAVRPTTNKGFSNQASVYAQAWSETTHDPEGPHPTVSNAMWNSSKVPYATLVQTLKSRYGCLWNAKLAHRFKRPYLPRKAHGHALSAACPLCSGSDSIGHILGECGHPILKALHIRRHDEAVRMIFKAIQKGCRGGNFSIMDAGTSDTIRVAGAATKRIPPWVLPHVPSDELNRMRPDIMIIDSLPQQPTDADIAYAHSCTVHLVEVGYGPDTRWKETLEKKKQQHQRLKEALAQAGWTNVVEHVIVLGRAGCVYRNAQTTLEQLGLTSAQALKLMHKLTSFTSMPSHR